MSDRSNTIDREMQDQPLLNNNGSSSSSSSSQESCNKLVGGGGSCLICALFGLVILALAFLGWAVWATFLVLELGNALAMGQQALIQTHLNFHVTPDENSDHYKRLVEIGTADDYDCVLTEGFANCHNPHSRLYIFFTPAGPVYGKDSDIDVDDDDDFEDDDAPPRLNNGKKNGRVWRFPSLVNHRSLAQEQYLN